VIFGKEGIAGESESAVSGAGGLSVDERAALLDQASDSIFVLGLDHSIQLINASACRHYGWQEEEYLGRSVFDLWAEDRQSQLAAAGAALATGEWRGEMRQITCSGRAIVVESRWTLIRDGEGHPACFLVVNTDITERKQFEAHFLRAQRLESIGSLAGGIAHDLNNILAPILMAVEILRDDEADAGRLEILQSLEKSVRRGSEIVRQILSFSRGSGGEHTLVDLRHLVNEISMVIRESFPKDITFRVQNPRGLWPVTANSTGIHQVMMNLCVNARDAMPNGGTLTMTLSNVVLDEVYAGMNPNARAGAHVLMEVGDDGAGIPPEIASRIFDPFFTTKESGKGTGLGLSTVQTIVREHGGFIHLYSEPGRGTRFKVYLPAQVTEEEMEQPAAAVANLPRGRGELLLVVDDEATIREVARRTLERFGYRVLTACHGAEAIHLYAREEREIALVLTDMAMPVMDGYAVIIALKSMNPKVRIIASSGHDTNGGVVRAVGAGVEHFVPKPYTAETLLTTIRVALDSPPAGA
jgi:PAS domain S-box-containing protein